MVSMTLRFYRVFSMKKMNFLIQDFANRLESLIPENPKYPIFNASKYLLFSVTANDTRIEIACRGFGNQHQITCHG
jgi:hypothetical protein